MQRGVSCLICKDGEKSAEQLEEGLFSPQAEQGTSRLVGGEKQGWETARR